MTPLTVRGPLEPMADQPPTHADEVENALLAFDADPSLEHERALPAALRAAGRHPEEIDRVVVEGRRGARG